MEMDTEKKKQNFEIEKCLTELQLPMDNAYDGPLTLDFQQNAGRVFSLIVHSSQHFQYESSVHLRFPKCFKIENEI